MPRKIFMSECMADGHVQGKHFRDRFALALNVKQFLARGIGGI